MKEVSSSSLIVAVSVFLLCFGNIAFFSNVVNVFPLDVKNSLFLLSLTLLFGCVNVILFATVCFKYTIKPVLISVLLVSATAGYFMDTYNVVIDDAMIDNVVKTDLDESLNLVSVKLFLYFFLLGIIPSIYIYKINVVFASPLREFVSRSKLIAASVVLIAASVLIFGNYYASFIREHKPLRYYANPSYYIYSTGKYVAGFFKHESLPLQPIGLDAKTPPADEHKELVILVLGEAARYDRFSLNGYEKETNPYLKQEDVISFANVWSCGTSTASAVPCIFSIYDQSEFNKSKARATENVLDVLKHAGINVFWMDNNSDSKGVAVRVPYKNYKSSGNNLVCDTECRDEGMLDDLQDYIDKHRRGDIFIVLHQMGNHGPEYYKRYPPQFEKFVPVCKTNQLEECTREEVNNAYDNAILYTDYFLSRVIALLKKNSKHYESAMFYISDHGESLGENGLFLHGLPYLFAPEEQIHVPLLMWFSDSFDRQEMNIGSLRRKTGQRFSHDNVFHTILGLMEVDTAVYKPELDMIDHEFNG